MRAALYAVVMALLMIAIPSDSEAECAWVLWSQDYFPVQRDATADSAWKDKQECEVAATVRLTALEQGVSRVGGKVLIDQPSRSAVMFSPEGQIMAKFGYTCLPDTIDPRGPKAGGR